MIEPPVTHRKIIELWKQVAPRDWFSACGVDMATDGNVRVWKERVRQWRDRDSIPPKYWPRLIDVVEARFGILITARQLMLAAARKAEMPVQDEPHSGAEAA